MPTQQQEFLDKCKQSVTFFIESCVKIQHPSIGVMPFKLFGYQKRCLRDYRKHRFNIFLKCFAKGSMIWTPNGPVPIELIKSNDLVYSYSEATGTVETKPVVKAWLTGEKETVTVRTKTGHKSTCTLDHKFLTHRGWVEAQNLTTNDIIIEVNEPTRFKPGSDSEAILLGYLITDGYYAGTKGRRQFHFTNTRWKYLLEYQKHFQLKFNKQLRIRPHNKLGKRIKKKAYRLLTSCEQARMWLKEAGIWGDKAATKKIPEYVFNWDNRRIAILLNRLFAGDGWYSGSHCNEAGIGSESILLLNQIKQLLTRFGINSKLYKATEYGIAKLRIFGGDDFVKFRDQIGIFGKEPRHISTTKGFFFNRVKGQVLSIIQSGPREVYDIEVADNHNFLVDGAVAHNCRQSGISTLSGAYALWFAMFYGNKRVLIVSKRDEDAKDFLQKNVKFCYNNLPEWMKEIWTLKSENEHEIGFTNGSIIRSLTASGETLRSNASSLNIIDESAFIDDMDTMWAGGWSCLNPSSYIFVDGKMVTIGSLGNLQGEKWQEHNINVQSDTKWSKSDKFYINGEAETVIIKTLSGLKLECTKNHRLKDHNYEWIYADKIIPSQRLAIKAGYAAGPHFDTKLNNNVVVPQQYFIQAKNADTVNPICSVCGINIPVSYRSYKRNIQRNNAFICQGCCTIDNFSSDFNIPQVIDDKLAELVGYYVGDGSISTERPKRLRLAYDPQDQDLYNYFAAYADSLRLVHNELDANGAKEFRICSAKFIEWFRLNGFNSKTNAYDAVIPSIILQSHQSIRIAFLRGLFEADGWCYNCRDNARPNTGRFHLGLSSVSEKLIDQVQLILLELGIIFKKTESKGGFENSGKSFRLEATNLDNMIRFQRTIGFISARKNIHIEKQTSYEPSKYIIDEDGIFYDEVVSVERGRCMTVDISVPENNTYIANGFVSHNTLQHGGSVIVISTPNGVGNWYWSTWTEAIDKINDFNPIRINWWDMDWHLEYFDPVRKEKVRIAPTDNIRECTTKEDIEKYGEKWSPWLEGEFRGLQRKGESYKFRQEVLAEFIGSGGTILSTSAIKLLGREVAKYPTYLTATEPLEYINPVTGDTEQLDFKGTEHTEGLWVWNEPVHPVPALMKGNRVIREGVPGHTYVMGVDVATGKNNDYSSIVVLDTDTHEQVAEFMGRVQPNIFCKMIDYVGRWYNTAFTCVDRTGIGNDLIEDLVELLYPNLWRKIKMMPEGTQYGPFGFAITDSTKPTLNKALMMNIAEEEDIGYRMKSMRLYKQAQIYIRKRNSRGEDTGKIGAQNGRGNYDDIVIAAGLAFIAAGDLIDQDVRTLVPTKSNQVGAPDLSITDRAAQQYQILSAVQGTRTDNHLILPFSPIIGIAKDQTIDQEIGKYAAQLITPRVDREALRRSLPAVSVRKRVEVVSHNAQQVPPTRTMPAVSTRRPPGF
jgi:intein/homing endonuclease